MHVRHEALFHWLERTFPGGKLYGPYHHGGRHYFQWMARGSYLRDHLLPVLEEGLAPGGQQTPKIGDNRAIAFKIALFEIAQQAAAFSDFLQEAATARVVLLVDLEVIGQLVDGLGEQRDLNLGRTGIVFFALMLIDDR